MFNPESTNIDSATEANIREDFPNSFNLIAELSHALLPNSSLVNETILLGSAISHRQEKGMTAQQSEDYLSMSLELLQKIQQELQEEQNIAIKTKVVRLKNHFLNKFDRKIVLETKHITKTYPRSKFSLKNISIQIYSGEVVGIIGKNGNGKTTLLKILACEIKADKGVLNYPAITYTPKTKFVNLKRHIAYIPQKIKDWGNIDTLITQLHFNAAIKGIRGKENSRLVNHFIQRLNLEKYKNLYWREISGGIQLRFEIAKALIWMPDLIVLDEPLANLDIKAQTRLLSDLRNVANSVSHPTAILISSQNLYELEKISDRVIFLSEGTVLHDGPIENIGANYKFNTYQIDSDYDLNRLKMLLKYNAVKDVEIDGEYYLIYTDKSCKKEHILRLLVDNSIPINYFRDITNSTRTLFESKHSMG